MPESILQIAEGMAFLEKEHFVHRNLGARNILVGERNVVKIAGFGMAKVQDDPDFNFRRGEIQHRFTGILFVCLSVVLQHACEVMLSPNPEKSFKLCNVWHVLSFGWQGSFVCTTYL